MRAAESRSILSLAFQAASHHFSSCPNTLWGKVRCATHTCHDATTTRFHHAPGVSCQGHVTVHQAVNAASQAAAGEQFDQASTSHPVSCHSTSPGGVRGSSWRAVPQQSCCAAKQRTCPSDPPLPFQAGLKLLQHAPAISEGRVVHVGSVRHSSTSGSGGSGSSDGNSSSRSSAEAAASYREGLYVVPFPKLSHTMEAGWLVKWHKQPGDRVDMVPSMCALSALPCYQLLLSCTHVGDARRSILIDRPRALIVV